jgi:hypothetical protein
MKSQSSVILPSIEHNNPKMCVDILRDMKLLTKDKNEFNTFLRTNRKTLSVNTTIDALLPNSFKAYTSKGFSTRKEMKTIEFDNIFYTSSFKNIYTSNSIKPLSTYTNSLKTLSASTTCSFKTLSSSANFSRKATMSDLNNEGETFVSSFAEYLGIKKNIFEKFSYIHNYNIDVEKSCLNHLERLRNGLGEDNYYMREFNEDNINRLVKLKLKSFKAVLEVGSVNRSKIYLPFDFMIIFCFCNYEELVLILSQCLEINEETFQITLNQQNLYLAINRLYMFERKSLNFPNSFKINRDFNFKWIGQTASYNIKIHCPEMSLYFRNKNLAIKQYLNLNNLMYFYTERFINWEYNLLNILSQEKEFRGHFNKIISKEKPYYSSKSKVKINIGSRLDLNPLTYDIDNISFPFAYTDDNKITYYVLFHAYSIDLKKFVKNTAYLNWKNSLVLFRLRDKLNLEGLVNRRCRLDDDQNIIFDTGFINNITEELYDFYSKSDEKPCPNKQIFKLNEPRLEFQALISGRFRKRRIFISNGYLEELATVRVVNSINEFVEKNVRNLQKDLLEEESKNILI